MHSLHYKKGLFVEQKIIFQGDFAMYSKPCGQNSKRALRQSETPVFVVYSNYRLHFRLDADKVGFHGFYGRGKSSPCLAPGSGGGFKLDEGGESIDVPPEVTIIAGFA